MQHLWDSLAPQPFPAAGTGVAATSSPADLSNSGPRGDGESSPKKEKQALTWLERMNMKLDSLLDIDLEDPHSLLFHTTAMVEDSVTSVGSSMRKLCSEFVRELLVPPYPSDDTLSAALHPRPRQLPALKPAPATGTAAAEALRASAAAEALRVSAGGGQQQQGSGRGRVVSAEGERGSEGVLSKSGSGGLAQGPLKVTRRKREGTTKLGDVGTAGRSSPVLGSSPQQAVAQAGAAGSPEPLSPAAPCTPVRSPAPSPAVPAAASPDHSFGGTSARPSPAIRAQGALPHGAGRGLGQKEGQGALEQEQCRDISPVLLTAGATTLSHPAPPSLACGRLPLKKCMPSSPIASAGMAPATPELAPLPALARGVPPDSVSGTAACAPATRASGSSSNTGVAPDKVTEMDPQPSSTLMTESGVKKEASLEAGSGAEASVKDGKGSTVVGGKAPPPVAGAELVLGQQPHCHLPAHAAVPPPAGGRTLAWGAQRGEAHGTGLSEGLHAAGGVAGLGANAQGADASLGRASSGHSGVLASLPGRLPDRVLGAADPAGNTAGTEDSDWDCKEGDLRRKEEEAERECGAADPGNDAEDDAIPDLLEVESGEATVRPMHCQEGAMGTVHALHCHGAMMPQEQACSPMPQPSPTPDQQHQPLGAATGSPVRSPEGAAASPGKKKKFWERVRSKVGLGRACTHRGPTCPSAAGAEGPAVCEECVLVIAEGAEWEWELVSP